MTCGRPSRLGVRPIGRRTISAAAYERSEALAQGSRQSDFYFSKALLLYMEFLFEHTSFSPIQHKQEFFTSSFYFG